MNAPIELTVDYINAHIGATINWECFGYKGNLPYKGTCKLLGMAHDGRHNRPIVEHISGDELKFGYDYFGTICYTDNDRTVLIQDTFNIYTAIYDTGHEQPMQYSFVVRKGSDPNEVAKKHITAEGYRLELTK